MLCRVVGVLTLGAIFVAALTEVPNRIGARLAVDSDVGPADAIVVLGASANRDGSLGDASLRRALAGITLYQKGLARRLVFLGMAGEAEARARLAVDLGIAPDAIIVEGLEPTTRDEAERMRVVLGERLGVRSVLLVTDVLHMRRSRLLFRRAGFTVRPASTNRGSLTGERPEARLILARGIVQELTALAYHRAFGYL